MFSNSAFKTTHSTRRSVGNKSIAAGIASFTLFSCAGSGGPKLVRPPDYGTEVAKKEDKVAQTPPVPLGSQVPRRRSDYLYEQHKLEGQRGTLNVVIFDPKKVNLTVDISIGGSTVQDIAKKPGNKHAIAVTNGPYFDGSSPHLYLKSGGNVANPAIRTTDRFFPENIEAMFVLSKTGNASVLPAQAPSTSNAVSSDSVSLAIQNGPWLIENGVDKSADLIEKYPNSSHMSKARQRTLLGITNDGQVILATISGDNGVNLQEATAEMKKRYGLKELVNMDGGPMTQMVLRIEDKTKVDIKGSNLVPAFLVVTPK